MADTKMAAHCVCGSALTGRAAPPSAAERLTGKFWELHAGAGHGPTTAAKASAARRREEAALVRSWQEADRG